MAETSAAPPVAASQPRLQHQLRIQRLAVLLAFTIIITLAGTFSIGPLDRDESRFMQATTQMLETGDYINIRFQEDERNKKPVGIYWLQAASVTAFSDVESRKVWPYRVPSFLAGLLSITLLYWAGCRLFDEETAFLAALLMAAAPVFAAETTIAKTDGTLLATVIAAQAALAAIYMRSFVEGKGPHWGVSILFWVALGFGVLIKGPIAPMISIATGLAIGGWQLLSGSAGKRFTALQWVRAVKPFTGLVVMLVLVSPWMIAIGIETQGRFFEEALGTDMLGKASQVQESHGGPFGYHFIAMWVMFWPAMLLLPSAFRVAVTRLAHPGVIFCLCWLIPSWLIFEIASTKLPHYTMPLYPALALLVAFMVTSLTREATLTRLPIMKVIGTVLYLFVATLVCVLFLYAPAEFGPGQPNLMHGTFALITVVWSLYNAAQLWRAQWRHVLISSSLLSALVIWFVFEGMLARLQDFQTSPNLSAMLEEQGLHPIKDGKQPVALFGYNEPSIVFLLGTETKLANAVSAVSWLSSGSDRVLIVEDRQHEAFVEELNRAAPATQYRQIGVVTGHNYSKGKDLRLTLYISQ
jgi:4-amino-4-deoxy-L-arabinose transferase-like glycosyltransferase